MNKLGRLIWLSLALTAASGDFSSALADFLPAQVDLSASMPPPGDQGAQGSAVGWAVSYARAYYTKKIEKRDNSLPENIPSPAYIYDSIKAEGDCNSGAKLIDALALLRRGSVSQKELPYDASTCGSPSEELRKKADDFRISDYSRLPISADIDDTLKSELARGNPVVLVLRITKAFEALSAEQIYDCPSDEDGDLFPIVAVGYDEGRAAFKLLNSWGAGWSSGGYGWIAYGLARSEVKDAYVMKIASLDEGRESKRASEVQKSSSVLHMLAIGVNQYEKPLNALRYASSDANAVEKALGRADETLYQSVQTSTLLDQAVTKPAVEQRLKEIAEKADPDDTFILYMSGHGLTQGGKFYYILPAARSKEDLINGAGISSDDLRSWLASIRANHKLVIADVTQSGSLTRLAAETGTAVLAATSENSPAVEGYRDHGLFTSILLDALEGADADGDGYINVVELAAYLSRRVPEASFASWKILQTPQFGISGPAFAVLRRRDRDR